MAEKRIAKSLWEKGDDKKWATKNLTFKGGTQLISEELKGYAKRVTKIERARCCCKQRTTKKANYKKITAKPNGKTADT